VSTLKVNNLQVGQDGTAANNYTLYQPASPDGTVRLGYGVAGSVTDILTLKNSRLGIGTDNPAVALHVIGDITMEDNSPRLEMHDANAATNLSCTGGIELFDQNGIRGAYMGATEGANFLSFGISPSAGAAPTEKLRITSDGKLGLGETSPDFKFHSKETGGSSIAGLFETNQTDSYISFQASGTTASSTVRIGAVADNFVAFVNGGERLRIFSDGRVSLGANLVSYTSANMSSAADDLVVAPPAGANGGLTIVNSGVNDIGNIFFANGTGETGIGRIQYEHQNNELVFTTNNTAKLRVESGGATTMHVNSASHETFRFTTQAVNEAKLIMKDAGNNEDIVLNTGGDSFFVGNGEFGIGTNTPASKLEVRKDNTDTTFTDSNTPSGISGVKIANLSPTVGCFTTLCLSVSNGSSTQNANIIAQSVSGGTSPDIHIATRNGESSVTKLTIDSAGRVTTPLQPLAIIGTTINNHTPSTGSVLQFDYVNTNRGNHYNTSNYTFTCPVSGDYMVILRYSRDGWTGDLELAKNNSQYARLELRETGRDSTGNADWQAWCYSFIIPCSANDTLKWKVGGTYTDTSSTHSGYLLDGYNHIYYDSVTYYLMG